MIKLAVFDFNGVLLADVRSALAASNDSLQRLGLKPIGVKKYRETLVIPASEFYVKNGVPREKIAASQPQMIEWWHSVYEDLAARNRLREGARKILAWLKSRGIRSIVVSNHTVPGIRAQLARLKLDALVDEVLANSEPGSSFVRKRKFEMVKAYLQDKGIAPNDAVIIGDSPEEVEIGRRLGLRTVAISRGWYSTERLKAAKPDYLINNLLELEPIVMN